MSCTIFHCHRAAIFSEQWRLVTAPILAREITLTVWGIAKDLRQLGQDGDEIDREIEDKCQSSFVQNILDGVIDRMFWEPPPKRTEGFPEHVDPKWFKSITGRDLFASTNPGHFYRSETVAKIIEIAELSLPENKFDKWSLPVSTIRQSLLYMQEEVKLQKQVVLKNEIANAFMTYVGDLTHGVDFPVTNRKYAMCKLLLLKVCNNICDIASRIKKAHGITLDMDFEIEFSKDDPRSQTDGRPNTPAKNRTKTPPKSPSRDSKTKKKHTSRDSSTPSSPTSPKSSRFGKLVKGISAAMKSQYKHRARPIMYMKYLEKLHISAYIIVKNYIYTISGFLADLPEVETLRL
ncbi:hypothetical protein LOTGIDRAFT_176676 [Lottia gigantea]|uniref:Uncharacterized protein n=1 Tax=Lottia gigantea TaxID=225164 RepID=V4ANN9_LOTGI|nr:hypothetical protein LOTGIDRAFT_176676 [Lottia gigantea]ESO95256.1 hypothetical protein LOTGIDRAFT_176676 [Lottia gigantea]